MKIKSVCEQTGLSDRSVRYYIEEQLLAPAYTENYLGRRSFDFTEADVCRLKEIAVLRKFGFTVAEIREMYDRPEEIGRMVAELKSRKESGLQREQGLLRALTQSEAASPDSVAALVAVLSQPVQTAPLPLTDTDSRSARRLRFLRALLRFLLTWLPVFFGTIALVVELRSWYYPVLIGRMIVLALLSLLPTGLMLLLPRLPMKDGYRKWVRAVTIAGCVLSMLLTPLLVNGAVARSETTDIRNYRRLDVECFANRDDLFQELFPIWPHYFENVTIDGRIETVYLDAHYLYRMLPAWNYTYDVYAEWPLQEEEFEREVARAAAVMEAKAEERTGAYHFVTIQKGEYTCLVIYDGDEPFEPVTGSYTYCIFAYNREQLRVRYLFCDSMEHGEDQPYYLELDWD